MTKIYIVEEGWCQDGDHHTCGVFSSPENAQAFIDLGGGESYYEYEIDAEMKWVQAGLSVFKVIIDAEGHTERILKVSLFHAEEIFVSDRGRNKGYCDFVVRARDEQSAIQIAVERRTQLIASGAWERLSSPFD